MDRNRQKSPYTWPAFVTATLLALAFQSSHATRALGAAIPPSIPAPSRAPVQASRPDSAAPFAPITLALKFVEFERAGRPVLSRSQALKVVEGMNALYAQCGLKLELEEYYQVNQDAYGLGRKLSSPDEMDSVRTPFDSSRHLVVIHTGAWDHRAHGAMGPANAWTAMPGQLPAGAVLEAPVADNGNITAHELGHYLGLDHARDQAELMNPVIYKDSVHITPAQCVRMRETAAQSRPGAIRTSAS